MKITILFAVIALAVLVPDSTAAPMTVSHEHDTNAAEQGKPDTNEVDLEAASEKGDEGTDEEVADENEEDDENE